jgi:molecular chaperone GrpE
MSKKPTAKKEKDERDGRLEELTDTLQRLQAEFENFKKRNERESQQFQEYANARLISEFLPLLDSFEQAVQLIQSSEKFSREQALEGTRNLQEQFTSLLREKGLEAIPAQGEKFNPDYHDCLLKESCDGKEDNLVLEELQKGYLFKGKVLRPAKVKINSIEMEKEESKE